MEGTKRCSKCGEVKLLDCFRERRAICKTCESAWQRQYRKANAATVAERWRKYQEANAAALNDRARKYREANAAAISARCRLRYEANAAAIADTYVKSLLQQQLNLPRNQIPDELVEMKRLLLKGKRTLTKLEKLL